MTVLLPGAFTASEAAGDYGCEWTNRPHPLSGLVVASAAPVAWAVTLVEVRPIAERTAFTLTAQATPTAAGGLRVTIAGGDVYELAADGRVTVGDQG